MPVPGRDGRHLLAVLSAAYRSAAEGKEVVIEDHHAAYADRSGPAAGLFNPGPAGPANAR